MNSEEIMSRDGGGGLDGMRGAWEKAKTNKVSWQDADMYPALYTFWDGVTPLRTPSDHVMPPEEFFTKYPVQMRGVPVVKTGAYNGAEIASLSGLIRLYASKDGFPKDGTGQDVLDFINKLECGITEAEMIAQINKK